MKKILPFLLTSLVCVILIFANVFWIFAILLALLSFIVFKFVFYNRNDELKEKHIKDVFGTTEYKIKTLLNYGRSKVLEIKKIRAEISDKNVKMKLDRIVKICVMIFDELSENPKVVTKLRRFFNYNLESTVTIIKKYHRIADYHKKDSKLKEVILKTEDSLDFIAGNFEALYQKLQNDSAEDINLDIEVLKKSMESEIKNFTEKIKEM